MTLEDFEKSLAEEKNERRQSENSRDKDRSRSHRHHHHHRHHHRDSSRTRDKHHDRSEHRDEHGRHRHKRSRRDENDDDDHGDGYHKKRHQRDSNHSPVHEETLTGSTETRNGAQALKRDSWMEQPSANDIDYINRPKKSSQEQPKPKTLGTDFGLKIHEKELNRHLRDLAEGKTVEEIETKPAQHDASYTFGDAGSQWRMTKLKSVYRVAKESGRKVEDVAIEKFGDLRSFDDAREEETELDRRERYGESYVGKIKPSGELFQERKLSQDAHRTTQPQDQPQDRTASESAIKEQGKQMDTIEPTKTTHHLDATALNRLRAKMMKAKLKGSTEAAELEEQYNAAAGLMANRKEGDVVVLGVMDNRMLAGARGEVKPVENRRGRERGQVQENDDMSIEDMLREERRTRGQAGGEGLRLAERIAKDNKFDVSFHPMLVLCGGSH